MNRWGPVSCVILSILAGVAPASGSAVAMTLSEEGRTTFSIVLGADATGPEKTAARELRLYLNRITGADFPVVTESEAGPRAPQILVGQSQRLKDLLLDVDWPALGHDGIVIRTTGNKLLLAGGRPRGSLYAVYTFLEETAGCRWWTSTEEYVPSKPTLEIPQLDIAYTPKLIYREASYRDPNENPLFAAKLKLNGHFNRIPPRHGGHYSIIGWCHTFFKWLPPENYFSSHPKWYSEIDGERSAGRTQLCLTNEEMREEMVRVCLEQIRENPSAGMISVSQNDWHGACQCANCRAMDAAEGSPAGTLLHFVNAVAEEIEKEFPEVLVETLAYQYTRKPPRHVRPRKNVVVRLCSIECSFTHPLDSEENAPFRDDLRKWSEIAPNLYAWDYVANFSNYILPHPNLRVLGPNLRFFVENNVTAVFAQGDRHTTVGDFVRLRAWVLAHLMWNPARDPDKLIAEFLKGYYGPAAPHLSAYLNLVEDAAKRAGARIGCYNQDTSFLELDDSREAVRLFEKAMESVAHDAVLTGRVRRERLPLDHVRLLRHEELKSEAEDRVAASEEFIRLAGAYRGNRYSENRRFDAYAPSLRLRFSQPPPPEELEKLSGQDAVVVQEAALRLHNPPKRVEIVADAVASNGKAARMPGGHTQWAIQHHVPRETVDLHEGKWRCYLVVRCEAKAKTGAAFSAGLYDNGRKREVVRLDVPLDRMGCGEYRTIDLGLHELRSNMSLWVAPPGNGEDVQFVYVDRMVLLRE